MHYHKQNTLLVCFALLLVQLLYVYQLQVVLAVHNPTRSVIQCDSLSFSSPDQAERTCSNYCTRTYVRTSAKSTAANREVSQSYLEGQSCCCIFNAFWPEYVNVKAVGREKDFRTKTKKVIDCLPLVISFNLSQKTKRSYEVVCQYLSRRDKLNVLEMMQYAEAAYFLNYMKPKHPAIRKTMHLQEVSRLDKEAVGQLREAYKTKLLDTLKVDIKDYEGYRLDPSALRRLSSVKDSIRKAWRSRIIAESLDELVISRALVDLKAASMRVQDINRELQIPIHLLEGNYDKYNSKNKARYFSMPGIDCKYLRQTYRRVSSYLTGISMSLSNLYEKLVYETMSEKFKPLTSILESEKLYKNLIDVNCRWNQ